MEELAERAGLSRTALGRVETNQSQSLRNLETIAAALGVTVEALLSPVRAGLAEDAAPYEPPPAMGLDPRMLGPHQSFYRVSSNALDRIHIRAGDILIVDSSSDAIGALKTGDAVLAQVADPDSGEAISIVRQYLAPSLLLANTSETLPPVIDLDRDAASVVAAVRFVFHKPTVK